MADGDKFENNLELEGSFYGTPENAGENTDIIKAVLGSILILLNIPIALAVFLLIFTVGGLILPFLLVGKGSDYFFELWAKYGWLLIVFIVNSCSIIKGYADDKKYFSGGYLLTFISYYIGSVIHLY